MPPLACVTLGAVLLCAALPTVSAGDDCGQHTSCVDCLGNAFCGWCSPGTVIYHNGTAGKRCASQLDEKWECPGKYQTAKCEVGFVCDPSAGYKCKPASQPGEGQSKAACESQCKKPAQIYKCDASTYTCVPVPAGTAGGGGKAPCEEHCKQQFRCDQTKWQCVLDETGAMDGMNHAACNEACKKPPSVYKCNPSGGGVAGNYSCEEATAGTAGATSKNLCTQQCAAPQPDPVTPNVLKTPNFWRGNMISKDYTPGEYDFDFQETSVTVTFGSGANKETYTADVSSMQVDGALEVWFTYTSDGPYNGKVAKGRLQMGPNGAETMNAVLAFGKPATKEVATAPATVQAAMAGDGLTVYVLSACIPGANPNCKFQPQTWNQLSTMLAEGGQQKRQLLGGTDQCNTYKTCAECTANAQQCGWCSVPVHYSDGSPGAQCAGFDAAGKPSPEWTCPAQYSRNECGDFLCDQTTHTCREAQPGEHGSLTQETCEQQCSTTPPKPDPHPHPHPEPEPPPPPPEPPVPLFVCNRTSFKCDSVAENTPGGIPQETCAAQCIEPPAKNNTPVDAIGTWRGIGIQNGYSFGEWDVLFDKTTATFSDTTGALWHAGVSSGGASGAPMTLTPTDGVNSGQPIHCLYQTVEGPVTQRMTLAMGTPGSPTMPVSYDDAMANGFKVLYLVKCGASATDCDFSKSAPSGAVTSV